MVVKGLLNFVVFEQELVNLNVCERPVEVTTPETNKEALDMVLAIVDELARDRGIIYLTLIFQTSEVLLHILC